MKRVTNLLPILLAWCFAFSASAQCPNSLSGYTLLGEYGDSKYFISNSATNWNTAKNNAASNGGYLASITSQGENDFILSNINTIVFIGFNDKQTEGNFQWDSGESVGLNKFADTNASDRDYGKMNNWNGNWGVDNQYVSRKSIVEIPCGGGGGSGINITSCPNDIEKIAPHSSSNYSTNVSWNPPTATTDCAQGGLTITKIQGPSPGTISVTPASGQSVVYEITDACGNSEFCIFNVTVRPESPVVTCPSNITITAPSSSGAVVNYTPPSVLTYCNAADFQLNDGLPSGSLFPVGTTAINYTSFLSGPVGFCQVNATCNFSVTVNPPGGGGGDCPDNISGFTTIGEFGNSKYYLSNSNSKPTDAQAVASSNGGYLAVINSAGENNFIQQNINIMTYIGLNDAASEGNLKWVNNEPLTYNNVDPCGFCEENSGSKDYVIMAPWNGKWSFSSQFNSRPYVMEIPCDGGGGPDECSFSNTIPLGFTGFGSSLTELNETNAGYQLVSADLLSGFERKFLEVTVNKDDGSVAGSNFVENNTDPGTFVTYWDRDANELYKVTVQSPLPNNTMTITKYGASNNVIWEKTSTLGFDVYNNSDIKVFDNEIIMTFGAGPTTSFGVAKANLNGNLVWSKNFNEGVEFGTGPIVLAESANNNAYYISYTNGGPFVLKLSGGSGNKIWKIDVGTGDPPSERRFILGESPNGQYYYMANSSFNNFKASVTRFNAFNGNETLITLGEGLPTGNTQERSIFTTAVPTLDGGVVVFFAYAVNVTDPYKYYHSRFDSAGNLVWRRETPTDLDLEINFNSSFDLIAAEDGGFILADEENDEFIITRMTSDGFFDPDCGGGGGGNKPDLTLANLDNVPGTITPNAVVNFEFDLKNIGNATATNGYIIGAYISSDNNLSNDDFLAGEVPTGNTFPGTDPNVPGAITVPNILVSGNYYLILKADINNSINESNENNNTIAKQVFIDVGGSGSCNNPPTISGFTFKTSVGNKAYYLSNGSDKPADAQNKCAQAGGNLATVNNATINNALKPFTNSLVYIGLNDENTEGSLQWRSGTSVSYTNFDNCSICEPNSGSKDYVVMQGWNGKWSWSSLFNSRKYWLEVDCNNLNSNNNSTLIALPTNEERELLDFQKIVPNPANNHIFVQIKSETEMAIDVEVYDARGVLLKTQPSELFDGINTIEMNIADLPGGFYLVKIPQLKGRYATKRFVKVRD